MFLSDRLDLITVNATLLDTAQRPITGGGILVSDADHHALSSPDEVSHFSGFQGQVTVYVIAPDPSSDTYYIQGSAQGYLPTTIQVTSAEQIISVTIVLEPKPLPSYPLTTVRAKIVEENGQPIPWAMVYILDASGNYLDNWFDDDTLTDKQGEVERHRPNRRRLYCSRSY